MLIGAVLKPLSWTDMTGGAKALKKDLKMNHITPRSSSKTINLIAALGLLIAGFWFQACQKCELIDQDITYPPKTCSGTFYFNKVDSAMDTNYSFTTLDKRILVPIQPTFKAGPFGTPAGPLNIRSNFSAYDSIHGVYVFEYYSPSLGTTGFYANQTVSNTSTSSVFTDFYVSPVFQNGDLYAIILETFGTDLQYSIVKINPLTGQDGTGVIGNSVTINSPADPQYFSSAAAKNGLIYFLGGTNLIEYNAGNNSTRYFDIDPTFNAIDNPVGYAGLEYDRNQDVLLCMKTGFDALDAFHTTLISLKITPAGPQQTHVYDIGAHLPSGHGQTINPDFYSTTFDACDTTYYITELNTFNPMTTNFIEIAINRQQLTNHVADGFWYGLELGPKQ